MDAEVTRRPGQQSQLKNEHAQGAGKPANGFGENAKNFKIGEASTAALPSMFQHADWTMLRNLDTLGQKAGVGKEDIPRLVAKELADNACDAAGTCSLSLLPDGGLRVEDNGEGISGTAEYLGRLFSVNRPLVTSKLIRLPTRGALGNGLRVVAGAVLATGGKMKLATRGSYYSLRFDDDGSTTATRTGDYKGKGVRIDLWLGNGPWPTGGFDEASLDWARRTVLFSAGAKSTYKGRTSAFWYDSASFFELLQAAGEMTVRELVNNFESCSGGKAGMVADGFLGRSCPDLSRSEADELLGRLREHSRAVKPSRLGLVGAAHHLPAAYASAAGTFKVESSRGRFSAEIPFLVEVWAAPARISHLRMMVNRTPATSGTEVHHEKAELNIFGCGLHHAAKVGRSPVELWVNVQCPHMPITTDGKSPDLTKVLDAILETIRKAARKVRRPGQSATGRTTEKDLVETNLGTAIKQAGGDQAHDFSLRQLFYVVRALISEDLGKELQYQNFTKIVGDHEAEHGEIAGLYRDPRGVIYHPHLHEEIPLGTRTVKEYRRVPWTFNKVLFVEKEGFFSALKRAKWPERHDCALLTSKGFATRAVRDLLDMLGESEEPSPFTMPTQPGP